MRQNNVGVGFEVLPADDHGLESQGKKGLRHLCNQVVEVKLNMLK